MAHCTKVNSTDIAQMNGSMRTKSSVYAWSSWFIESFLYITFVFILQNGKNDFLNLNTRVQINKIKWMELFFVKIRLEI